MVALKDAVLEHPRLGERLAESAPREVHRLLIGDDERRYEVDGDTLFLLRVWHSRESASEAAADYSAASSSGA
ncbi:hypothetical protein [Neorhizobium alkalisoli]|uniref:hypothetical protein n=1 Tax=Neorhizobium alkalisoli TaxID=528178 RepID=UPI000CF85991|nr:hypothetical protein [Neorhizobium alkalisoli]